MENFLPKKRNRENNCIPQMFKEIVEDESLEIMMENIGKLMQVRDIIRKKLEKTCEKSEQDDWISAKVEVFTNKIADFFRKNPDFPEILEKIITFISKNSFFSVSHHSTFTKFLEKKVLDPEESAELSQIRSVNHFIIPIIDSGVFSIICLDNEKEVIEYYTYNVDHFERNCQICENLLSEFGIIEKYDWELMEIPEFINNNALMTWTLYALGNNLDITDFSESNFIEFLSNNITFDSP